MASPAIGADGVDAVNAALVRKAITSNAKLDCKAIWGRLRYTGSAWEVASTTDSSQLVSGNLSWSTDHLVIALTGYTAAPVVLVSQSVVAVCYFIQATATSSGSISVYFKDTSSAVVGTQAVSMDIEILIIGA